jgi:hypothetical protein
MAKSRTKTILAIVTPAVFGSACGAILGIEDGILDPVDSGSDALAESGIDGGGTDARADAQDEDAGPTCVPDASDSVDDMNGIFVAPAPYGTGAVNCGSRVVPCASLQMGVERALTLTRSKVFIARGTYAEAIRLHAGTTLIGGWDPLDTTWLRSCKSPPHDVVVIQSPTNITVLADELGGTAGLETVTVSSKAAADTGETLYGVFARGATTHLTLFDVIVSMSAGGNGGPGGGGAPGGAAATTDCPSSTGAQGDAGATGRGADGGLFGDAGFVSTNGTTGQTGFTGEPGTGAMAPACTTCGACQGIVPVCSFKASGQSCGTDGGAGCGGGPGTGGTPGAGGGSSIALFAWDAIVTVTASRLAAGPGGLGGGGGLGGDGGVGSGGASGRIGPDCVITCDTLCGTAMAHGAAGSPGGSGGPGGPGGPGGGGAGGDSIAIVQAGAAVVTAPDAGLSFRAAGTSLGNGATGRARARFP